MTSTAPVSAFDQVSKAYGEVRAVEGLGRRGREGRTSGRLAVARPHRRDLGRKPVFAALGVAIGYLASGDAVRPITMIIYFGLAMLGGLRMPTTTFPQWPQDIAEWLPAHAYAALGQAIEQSRAPHAQDLAILAVSFALFAGGAAWPYRKVTLKA